jgi:small ligand-binding sensory domain FIST
MKAAAAIAEHSDWQEALATILDQTSASERQGQADDLIFLFASGAFAGEFPELLQAVLKATGAATVAGCSGWGVIGPSREIEGVPAISMQTFALQGASLHSVHISQSDIEEEHDAAEWRTALGVEPVDVNAWFVFADPFYDRPGSAPPHSLRCLSRKAGGRGPGLR